MRTFLLPSLSLVLVVAACGSSSDGGGAAARTAGSSGASSAGAGGTSSGGKAGGPAAGKGGAGAAGAGAAGTAGGGASGNAGAAGGKAGAAGASGTAGMGGSAGGAGSPGGSAGAGGGAKCAVDGDCKLPVTTPPDCAVAKCDNGACRFLARDNDGDGHRTNKCAAASGAIEVGTDCDDNDPSTFVGAWDGPAGGTSPDRCDGVDNDCNGAKDDARLMSNGASCTCVPGDVAACAEDSSGKPITFPGGQPQGLCKKGSKTCLPQGIWSACTGVVAPQQESCDGFDNDCNGKVDDNPIDGVYFVYDGDDDLRGAKGCPKVYACKDKPPTDPPMGCGVSSCATCAGGWKFANAIPADDCDDTDATVNPLAKELCGDPKDSDCDGAPNNGCPCVNGQTQACWDGAADAVFGDDPLYPTSVCQRGTQTCDLGGNWGACTGQVFPKTETCSGKDENCNGVVDEGFDVGATCNVGGSASGTCLGAGAIACDAAGGATCVSGTPGVGDAVFHDAPGPNASFDWSCDGIITKEATSANWVLQKYATNGCMFSAARCTSLTGQAQCLGYPKTETRPRAYFCGDEVEPACGATFVKYTCTWDAANAKCLNGTTEDIVQRCH